MMARVWAASRCCGPPLAPSPRVSRREARRQGVAAPALRPHAPGPSRCALACPAAALSAGVGDLKLLGCARAIKACLGDGGEAGERDSSTNKDSLLPCAVRHAPRLWAESIAATFG
jgi:hypothetical protein